MPKLIDRLREREALAGKIKKQTSADSEPIIDISWDVKDPNHDVYELTATFSSGKKKQVNVYGTDFITKNPTTMLKK